MTLLVTGGGGFIGRGIVRALVERGERVRVFCRGDYPDLRDLGVELHRGDLADGNAVAAAVAGCDGVFHVAARFDLWGRYEDFFQTNVQGTRHVIRACHAHEVRKLVYTSTPSVVHGGDSIDGVNESAPYPERFEAHYPATKAMAEREILATNDDTLSTVAIRPHLVWGPGDTSVLPRLVARAKAGRLTMVGEPQPLDTTYIDNAVLAHLLAYDRLSPGSPIAGKAYFITQDEPLPGPQFINDMLAAVGLPPVTRSVSATFARSAAVIVESVWKLLRLHSEPPVTRYLVSQLSTAHWYDISAARRDLGYQPNVSYAEGMKRLKAWAEPTMR
ncbi:MAG: NAD-dependent epimerase/dehydratase family protein [Myxococcales bacterium]|nr:NAD-dependent epimerase/dehydratase family protein [Myxococcales bacterium]MDH3483872.1 NAD-dependent epimerase/dehydratase family protein [Myxococcales bacterium]